MFNNLEIDSTDQKLITDSRVLGKGQMLQIRRAHGLWYLDLYGADTSYFGQSNCHTFTAFWDINDLKSILVKLK